MARICTLRREQDLLKGLPNPSPPQEGAVHNFAEKGAGTDNSKRAAYNEQADRRSWEAMKEFFAEIFGGQSIIVLSRFLSRVAGAFFRPFR